MRPPSGTNLKALPSRFITTRCSLSGSTAATHGAVGVHGVLDAPIGGEHGEVRGEEADQRGDVGVLQLDLQLAAPRLRDMSSRSLTCLSSMRALRATTCAGFAPLRQAHRPVVVDQPLRGTEDQRQRRAQLVADVGEELRLDLVELADALEQALQLDVLLRDLALLRLLLGDVAPFAGEEHDLALIVLHGHERGVDDDRHRAVGARVERRVPADELALRRARDRVADALVDSSARPATRTWSRTACPRRRPA